MGLVTRPPRQSSSSVPKLDDDRYPRWALVRYLRGALVVWWVILSPYPMIVVNNLYQLVAQGSVRDMLNPLRVAQALLLDKVAPLLTQSPAVSAPFLAGLVGLIVLGQWAKADLERELLVLERREQAKEQSELCDRVIELLTLELAKAMHSPNTASPTNPLEAFAVLRRLLQELTQNNAAHARPELADLIVDMPDDQADGVAALPSAFED